MPTNAEFHDTVSDAARCGGMDALQETGTVKVFFPEKGFGFIFREGCQELFFHISALQPGDAGMVQKGTSVVFVVGSDKRGRPMATSVTPLTERGN